MKSATFFLLLLLPLVRADAQRYVPAIKEGTVLSYDSYRETGRYHVYFTMAVRTLGDSVRLQFDVKDGCIGGFDITAVAFKNGSRMKQQYFAADKFSRLPDDETLLVLSKSNFSSLIRDKTFILNDQKFTLLADTNTYLINGKAADIIHVKGGRTELWILNNPVFPLIYKANGLVVRGMKYVQLKGVKE